jgi:hypothetical protein
MPNHNATSNGMIVCILVIVTLTGCGFSDNRSASPETILADTFFFGCAYLDTNGNGEVDAGDQGIEDGRFVVDVHGNRGVFAAATGENGCATIVIPGGLSAEDWPVTGRMESVSAYKLISPEEMILEQRGSRRADFLYIHEVKQSGEATAWCSHQRGLITAWWLTPRAMPVHNHRRARVRWC